MSFKIYIQTPVWFPQEPNEVIDVDAVEVTDEDNQTTEEQ